MMQVVEMLARMLPSLRTIGQHLILQNRFVTKIVLPSFVDSRIGFTQKLVDDMVDRLSGCP